MIVPPMASVLCPGFYLVILSSILINFEIPRHRNCAFWSLAITYREVQYSMYREVEYMVVDLSR